MTLTLSKGFWSGSPSGGPAFQGENYGYATGDAGGGTQIRRYSFTSDGNSTLVGDLTHGRSHGGGQSSSDYGYTSCGYTYWPSAYAFNVLDRFSFASGSENASDVGDMTVQVNATSGYSSTENGYQAGGYTRATTNINISTIDRFSFASASANASEIGDLLSAISGMTGCSSPSHGYSMGGGSQIQRFSFAAGNQDATDVGDLTFSHLSGPGGCQTGSEGYACGGSYYDGSTSVVQSEIAKFAFASSSNAADNGDLTVARSYGCGTSSTEYGYVAGGYNGSTYGDVIDKFSFAAGTQNSSDVGDLNNGPWFLPVPQQF